MRQIGRRASEQGSGNGVTPAAPPRLASWLHRRLRAFELREWRLPAYAGLKGTALLFAATAIAGVVSAGRVEQVAGDIGRASGLVVDNVRISGQIETSEVAVLDRLELQPDTALPFIDVAAARARIETLPWVKQATLRKVYPSTLKITIEERAPIALWQHDQTLSVIDANGRVMGDAGEAHGQLLRLIGKGSEKRADEALALADAAPPFRDHVRAAMLVGERRWNLLLDNGVTLLLPEQDPKAALARIAALDESNGLLSKDIVSIDLRLDGRMYVRLTPDAAARRLAAIKEQEKIAKRKGASI